MVGERFDLGIDGFGPATLVGVGGFARVYRAEQLGLGRDVAIKVLMALPSDQTTLSRFDRECRALGAVSSHPSIVEVHSRGTTARGELYLVMEYRSGGSLADTLARSGPLPPAEVTTIGVRVADALAVAHEAGVLHRDVKPANILLTARGEPALADFGIARIDGAHKTESGQITASIAHAAREVLAGQEPTAQSDLYSLGSTLFELLTGNAPFTRPDDESLWALINRVMTTPAPDPAAFGVPQPLAGIVARALDHDPARRFATADPLRSALADGQASAATVAMPQGTPQDAATQVLPGATSHWPPPGAPAATNAPGAAAPGTVPTAAAPAVGQPVGVAVPSGAAGAPTRTVAEPPRRGRRLRALVLAMLALAVAGGGAWAGLVRPWEGGDEGPTPQLAVAQARIEPLLAGRRYALTIGQVPVGADLALVIDDGEPLPLSGSVPRWRAEVGRHRLELEVTEVDGGVVRSDPVEVYVSPGPPQGGFRANLASVRTEPESWSLALDLFDELVADGHDDLVISESTDGEFWQFYVDGFGDDREGAWAYCESFDLPSTECFAAET